MIIGLCGFQGSGKDTLANILVNDYGYIRLSFAGILKDVVSILFDWDRDKLEGLTEESRLWREAKDEWWSEKLLRDITPRRMLQEIGTDLFRNNFHCDIWLNCLENKLRKYKNKNVVISDCRFKNEIKMIKKYKGFIFQLNRNLPNWYNDYKLGKVKLDEIGLHSSEIEWLICKPDFEIDNSNSINELKIRFNFLMKLLKV